MTLNDLEKILIVFYVKCEKYIYMEAVCFALPMREGSITKKLDT